MAVAIKKAKLEDGVKPSVTINGEKIVGSDMINIGVKELVDEDESGDEDVASEVEKAVGLTEEEKEFDLKEYQFKDWGNIKNDIERLKWKLLEKELWLAKNYCPYRVGMRLKTNKGLGLVGLVVQEIVAPKEFGPDNKWEVVCYAIAKNGEITRRTVSFDENDLKDLTVTVVNKG